MCMGWINLEIKVDISGMASYFIYLYIYIHTDRYIYVCVTMYTDIKVSQNSDLSYEYDQL